MHECTRVERDGSKDGRSGEQNERAAGDAEIAQRRSVTEQLINDLFQQLDGEPRRVAYPFYILDEKQSAVMTRKRIYR